MEAKVNSAVISLIKGDITLEATDAIVNAANSRLAGGGGVDGAIHRAGGPGIMAECRKIGGCPTGGAVITTAGLLKAKKVIHTVGPIYKDGKHREAELLASAYLSSLKLAADHRLKSVSFPSISTGAYGYPVEEAAEVAIKAVISFLTANTGIDLVRFVLFSNADLETYAGVLRKLTS
ncbi:MAG: O-acetyl-ADP-ribose deacetylase [Deltaproteobacteria bacterium]|nr:O-acetyl-ADP-ribose deacetylase [Deltaproteobacteria bacterium]